MVTEGSRLLAKVMSERGLYQTHVASMANVTQAAVSRWLDGTSRPDEVKRQVLSARLGVPADQWLTDAEREEIARADESGALPAVTGTDS